MNATLLLIDDDEMLRELMAELLAASGFTVTGAEPGEALQRLARTQFDVLLCDQNLGLGMKGTEILAEARQRGLLERTACLLVTGSPPHRLGAPDGVSVLQKPFEIGALVAAISSALAQIPRAKVEARRPRPSLESVRGELLEPEHSKHLEVQISRQLAERRARLEHSSRALGVGRVAALTAQFAGPTAAEAGVPVPAAIFPENALEQLEGETESLRRSVEGLTAIARKLGIAV